jgi:teichuronic acid biosynthesis glycosyltransferase TuaG
MDKNFNLLVSIIMPAYNAERYILSSIQSVINQSFQNWELIIIDDGSTDNTAKIVKSIQEVDDRIVYFYQQNKRLGAARNSGFKIAKGNWIAFLDSDDLWKPSKLELQVDFVEKNQVDVVFTDGDILIEQTQEKQPYITRSGWFTGDEMYDILYVENIVPVLSVLMNRSWIDKIGQQDESMSIFGCEDWDYWLRIAKSGGKFYGISEKLFYYRVHSQAMSRNNTIMKLAESTALYNNIDIKSTGNKFLRNRFQDLCVPIIPELIKIGRRNDAIKQVEILLFFENKLSYKLLLFYLKCSKKLNNSIIYYLLNPRKILS